MATVSSTASDKTMVPGARLVVQDGKQSREWALGDQPITLGRRPDNTIVLTSRFVSGYHARIEPDGVAHRIIDQQSTNGLLYEGRYVEQHTLSDGDVIRIGDPTVGNFVSFTYHNSLIARPKAGDQMDHTYTLRTDGQEMSIGRGECDIKLDNPQVSRLHARLTYGADQQHQLSDVGSTNGTFVNGQRVKQHTLTVGDVVRIGPFKLIYRGASFEEYDQRGELHLDAHGLTIQVQQGKNHRLILNNVSLSIAPREFVALVGGSGAGKSTLLKALSGYAPASSGQVAVNGDDFYHNFDAYRALLGYVPQDDIIHPTLPVDRTLDYTSKLRLPSDMDKTEVQQRMENVLDDVEMAEHAAKKVLNLSGGQRKRVSMAVELLAEPSLFFLDEATSGLDPGLEKKTMYMLRRLADSGRTVLLVTHATENIVQCDHVVFMALGRMVYFGPPQEALTFFGVTSGDFADIYTRLEGRADPASPLVQDTLKQAYTHWQQQNPGSTEQPLFAELWEYKYKYGNSDSQPSFYQRYVLDRQVPAAPDQTAQDAEHAGGAKKKQVSSWRQYMILTRRYLDLMMQDRRNLMILLLQVPIIALVLLFISQSNVLLSHTDGIIEAGVIQRNEAKTVLFMIAIASIWFGVFSAAREIAKETPIFVRERLVNLRIGPYLFSKVTVLGLLALVQSAVFMLVLLIGIEFPSNTGVLLPSLPVLEMFITVLLSALASTALGLMVSAFVGSPNRAFSVVPLLLILQIVFAGLIFKIEGLIAPLSWLTISRWSLDALGTSIELKSLCYLPGFADTLPCYSRNMARQEPDPFLPDAFVHEPTHLLMNWGILILYMGVCLGVTAWRLRKNVRGF
jgi:ABC-type multidrug transport system ATPase subunit